MAENRNNLAVHKSRQVLLEILKIRGFDISDYEGFSINEIYALYTNDQLESANDLSERGVIKDHKMDPKAYNLDENVLRQEIALISRRVSGFKENTGCKNTFSDVSSSTPNTWACKNIESLVDNDLITANESFRPEDSITKSEALIMFIRSIGFDFKINDMSNWQKEVVDFAVSK